MTEIEKQSGNNNLRRGNPAWGKKSEGNGKSGNPNGKPHKDCSLTTLVKSLIDTVPFGETKGRTWRQLLALAWLTGAMKNPVLMKELLDRLEGKVSQIAEVDVNVKHTPQELSDEQLAIIAATNILANNTRNGSRGVIKAEASPA